MNLYSEIFTDALGRPEVKNIIGIPCLLAGMVAGALMLWGVLPRDWSGFSIYNGFAASLITVTAVMDSRIDAHKV